MVVIGIVYMRKAARMCRLPHECCAAKEGERQCPKTHQPSFVLIGMTEADW